MKKFLVALIITTMMFSMTACGGGSSSSDSEKSEKVISYFMELTKVPRPSHHEEKITQYMHKWFEDMGYKVEVDKAGNVIADIPASEGNEKKPVTVLQGHMDMVCVADKGVEYDPLNDPIKVINDGETLTADGTSLGADDGIGVATIMYIADPANKVEHGPIRAILTVNEEDGATGVTKLSKVCIDDVKYLINLDAEEFGSLTNSTAGFVSLDMSAAPQTRGVAGDTAMVLSMSGLKGGHSGMEINEGRINAIKACAGILAEMDSADIEYELASFKGGEARNAIPKEAKAVFVISKSDKKAVQDIVKEAKDEYKTAYSETDGDFKLTLEEANIPDKVFTATQKTDIVTFATAVINGVQAMSTKVKGLVESSSNLGIVSATPKEVLFQTYPRSSEDIELTNMRLSEEALASACGLKTKNNGTAPPWPVNENSELVPIASKVYEEENGSELKIIAVHAGLECGTFMEYNPDTDMISIGPDLADVHTPKETLQIDSVGKNLDLLIQILKEIK